MGFNGYKRTKKVDIKRWLSGTNSVLYIIILAVFVAVILLALSTVLRMRDENNKEAELSTATSETPFENESEDEESSTYIAKNQTYSIKISKAKNIMVIYQMDSNIEFTNPVKAFYVSVNSEIKTGKTFISEKTLWKKLNDNSFVRFTSRLDNSELLSSASYYSQSIYNLNPKSYNNIGNNITEGSVFMTAANAKWIFENCGVNTPVEILEDFEIEPGITIEEIKTLPSWAYRDPIDEVDY